MIFSQRLGQLGLQKHLVGLEPSSVAEIFNPKQSCHSPDLETESLLYLVLILLTMANTHFDTLDHCFVES